MRSATVDARPASRRRSAPRPGRHRHVGAGDHEHRAARRRRGRRDPGRRVLDRDAVRRVDAEQRGGRPVRVRVRLGRRRPRPRTPSTSKARPTSGPSATRTSARSVLVTSAVGIPAARTAATSSRAPGRQSSPPANRCRASATSCSPSSHRVGVRPADVRRARCPPTTGTLVPTRRPAGAVGQLAAEPPRELAAARRPRPARSRPACRPCRTARRARHRLTWLEVVRLRVVHDDRVVDCSGCSWNSSDSSTPIRSASSSSTIFARSSRSGQAG